MALFKHEAACGTSAKLVLEPRETNYATITQMPQPSASYEQAIVLELTQYQRSMMADERSKAKIYSYYADNDTKKRIEQLFGSITHPERSEEHTSELQSLMRISYAVFCLKKKKTTQ